MYNITKMVFNIDIKDRKVQIVIALAIVLLVLVLYKFVFSKKVEKTTGTKNKTKKGRKTEHNKNANRKSLKKKKPTKVVEEEESSSSDDDEIDEALRGDAEELYNLAHEGLLKGIQKEDFKQLVGDLADDYVFIQLKQLYNEKEKNNQDPRSISVVDYIQILQDE